MLLSRPSDRLLPVYLPTIALLGFAALVIIYFEYCSRLETSAATEIQDRDAILPPLCQCVIQCAVELSFTPGIHSSSFVFVHKYVPSFQVRFWGAVELPLKILSAIGVLRTLPPLIADGAL